MKLEYSVEITKVAEEMMLEPVNLPDDIATRVIIRNDVSRPGLPLAGFFDHFESGRIQIIGNMEHKYIELLTHEQRMEALERFLSCGVVCIVVTRGLDIFPELSQLCEKYGTPLYLSHDTTSNFMAALIAYLNVQLAERITKHGVLIEVYGEGILMLGDSGIGKSETAIELVKRGHRLIADDAVEIKKVSNKTLVGAAPELIRHYVELRGIGLVDVRRIFGMGAVKLTEKIDLVYLYRNYNVDTVAFNHAFVAPAADAQKYLPGVTLPAGVNRDTRIRDVGIKDAHLARLHLKNPPEAQPAIYIDDIDLRDMDMSNMPDWALDIATNDGMFIETQDGKYKAYIYVNEMKKGRAGGTISMKRYTMF